MGGSKSQAIDWEQLRREYNGIWLGYIPFRVLTDEDLEVCKLSDMTYNMIESDHVEKIRSYTYISVHEAYKREQLTSLTEMLGLPDKDGYLEVDDRPQIWNDIDRAIKRQEMSNTFLKNWVLLNSLFENYINLYLGCRDEYVRNFHQMMMANADAKDIQRHWYANWICNASKVHNINKNDAQSHIIELIESIKNKEKQPWGPYKVEWFTSMLEKEKCSKNSAPVYSGDLKTSYTKLADRELKRMVEHPLITRRVLPPLSAKKFLPV